VFKPVFSTHELHLGDRLLFCSDGLSGQLDDDSLVALLGNPDANRTLDSLQRAVYAVGAPDNVTMIVADVVESSFELDTAQPQVLGAAADVVIPEVPHATYPDNPDDASAPESPASESGDSSPESSPKIDADADDLAWFDVPPSPETQANDIGGRKRRRVGRRPRDTGPVWQDDDSEHVHARRGLLVGVSVVFGVLALIAASLWGGREYLSSQFFIGDEVGQVAIFHGLPDEVIGIPLNWVAETSHTSLSDLPVYYADQVRDGKLRPANLEAARVTLAELEAKAAYCRSLRNPTTPPTTPGTTPGTPQGTGSTSTRPTSASPTRSAVTPTTTQLAPSTPPAATPGPEDCP
ncbi:MAG: hypothetical protein LBM94_04835, partial [Propionibacteriaceae bacterium]|jgi:protein phosphatase|nr:hypothetical protein [Propionibacteriaceae bacterium]